MTTTRTTRIVRLLLALAALPTATHTARALRHLEDGSPAPAFALKAGDGTAVTNETFLGKPYVVVFVRPRQAESIRALEEVGALLSRRADTGLSALVVPTVDDPDNSVGGYVREHAFPLVVTEDPGRRMYGDFGIIVSPTVLFVDAQGVLRFHVPHLPPGYSRRLAAHADLLLGAISQAEHAERVSNAPEEQSAEQRSFATRLAFARVLVRYGKSEQAERILESLNPAGGDSVEAAALMATVLLRAGDIRRAADLLARFEGQDPTPSDLHLALARLAVATGKADDAMAHLAAAKSEGASRDRSEILLGLGRLYEEREQPASAAVAYRSALEGLLEDGK